MTHSHFYENHDVVKNFALRFQRFKKLNNQENERLFGNAHTEFREEEFLPLDDEICLFKIKNWMLTVLDPHSMSTTVALTCTYGVAIRFNTL